MHPLQEDSPSALQSHITSLHNLSLEATIQALHDLLHQLTVSTSPPADRIVTHATISSSGDLNAVGRIYIQAAARCTEEHAPLNVRLEHAALDKPMLDLYVESHDQIKAKLKDGTAAYPPRSENEDMGCACCRGDPDAVILAGFVDEEALLFHEDEYHEFWPGEESCGMQSWGGGENGKREVRLKASKEQVERKIRDQVSSKL
ncbi:hypothetical protein BJY04DRAFT_179860 [Aspergillus karnatakaensis]|uniref:uncharacterized protein n=1 Tax=Aspergillus karnatakaensis TaxID=1810916 RepID=UPI003CCD8BCC